MKKLLLALLFPAFSLSAVAQISFGGQPESEINASSVMDQNKVELLIMPSFDLAKVQLEDAENDLKKDIPQRFGFPFDLKKNLENSGTKETLPNGDQIWRLRIKSANAQTINLQFNQFHLEPETRFFIYNADKSQMLGAFTERNNKQDGKFATGFIKGEEIILELNQPKNTIGHNQVELSKVVHGYRTLKGVAGFGTSGGCNNNVICPEGDPWRDEIRGSAMVLLGSGTRWCSGSMLNNVREDGSPYFLTANHCLTTGVSSWIIMFNYESPDCAGTINGPLSQTLQGATLIATWETSDFALLMLDDVPPKPYNVYYNGWSAENIQADSVVGIHHPDGDIKKISFDYDTIVTSGYFGPGIDHWKVIDWDDGTTEGGSSGSPLFNKTHHIVGQLHGGNAACGNDDEDYYGKVSYSWDLGADPSTRLKDWLDPANEGILVLDGRDFNVAQDSIDLALSYVDSDTFFCAKTLEPVVKIRNVGSDTITKAVIYYEVDTKTDSILWSGSLACMEEQLLSLPLITLSPGTNTIKIYSAFPNDSIDPKPKNDTVVRSFVGGKNLELNVVSDFFGSQTGVFLVDSMSDTLYARTGYPDLATTTEDFCLPIGCYRLFVTDQASNGMCCSFGQGFFNLVLEGELIIATGNFTDSVIVDFCVTETGYTASYIIKGLEDAKFGKRLEIAPNPTSGVLAINTNQIPVGTQINLLSIEGKMVRSVQTSSNSTLMDLTDLDNGVYFLQARDKEYFYNEKVVVVK